MMKFFLGAVLVVALHIGGAGVSFAASGGGGGDGLDRNAAATGNSTFAGQHRGPGVGGTRMIRHQRHHHRRHHHRH